MRFLFTSPTGGWQEWRDARHRGARQVGGVFWVRVPSPFSPERLPAPGVGGGVEVVPHRQSFGPAEARRPAKGQHVGWPERGGADSQGSVKAVVAAGAGC